MLFSGLPIQLLSFTASKITGGAVINWTTAIELNTKSFVLEFSNDNGITWSTISTQPAIGPANGATYKYTHNYNGSGTVLYRLKSINDNNSFDYSNTYKLNFDLSSPYTIVPNPATTAFSVIGKTNLMVNLKIYTTEGKLISSYQNYVTGKTINIQHLSKGIYLVVMIDNAGNKTTNRLVIQ